MDECDIVYERKQRQAHPLIAERIFLGRLVAVLERS